MTTSVPPTTIPYHFDDLSDFTVATILSCLSISDLLDGVGSTCRRLRRLALMLHPLRLELSMLELEDLARRGKTLRDVFPFVSDVTVHKQYRSTTGRPVSATRALVGILGTRPRRLKIVEDESDVPMPFSIPPSLEIPQRYDSGILSPTSNGPLVDDIILAAALAPAMREACRTPPTVHQTRRRCLQPNLAAALLEPPSSTMKADCVTLQGVPGSVNDGSSFSTMYDRLRSSPSGGVDPGEFASRILATNWIPSPTDAAAFAFDTIVTLDLRGCSDVRDSTVERLCRSGTRIKVSLMVNFYE